MLATYIAHSSSEPGLCIYCQSEMHWLNIKYVQGMVIHADVFAGQNTDKHIQHDHINTSGHTFTPAGKQRSDI